MPLRDHCCSLLGDRRSWDELHGIWLPGGHTLRIDTSGVQPADRREITLLDNDGVLDGFLVLTISLASWQNPGTYANSRYDVSNDRFVSPIDALSVINELNKTYGSSWTLVQPSSLDAIVLMVRLCLKLPSY